MRVCIRVYAFLHMDIKWRSSFQYLPYPVSRTSGRSLEELETHNMMSLSKVGSRPPVLLKPEVMPYGTMRF